MVTFFSKGPVFGYNIKNIIAYTIQIFKYAGLIPNICDQGTNNVAMRKMFGVTRDCPYFIFDDEKIYFFYDTPHLLKSVRNNLKKYNFSYDNNTYSWNDIVDFYKLDKEKKPRYAPKLKKI